MRFRRRLGLERRLLRIEGESPDGIQVAASKAIPQRLKPL
jgi:hypothetical protein